MKYSFQNHIDQVSNLVGKTWPLYSFVTSNPLAGHEDLHFTKAVQNASNLFAASVYPKGAVFYDAWQKGEIDQNEIQKLLHQNNFKESPEHYLKELEKSTSVIQENPSRELDRILVKWLMAFMDEGLADWEMPNRGKGFYKSWRKLAKFDLSKNKFIVSLPKTTTEALCSFLLEYSDEQQKQIIQTHLAALSGWVGYIKYREEFNSLWQQKYPITIEDYLAVRFTIAKSLGIDIIAKTQISKEEDFQQQLQYIFLKAWETSWQKNLVQELSKLKNQPNESRKIPDAQMVFCIDTRSEAIRRHIENQGNYETYGYAGFFGIAMNYTSFEDGITRKSCPPIVNSAYYISDVALSGRESKVANFKEGIEKKNFKEYFFKRMKNMLPSAFGYVEGSGAFYGMSMISRTLFPQRNYSPEKLGQESFENECQPIIKYADQNKHQDISIDEKVGIVKSAIDLMGWEKFASLILIVGHGSHSANNPFASSLNCGACAAMPGRHNARMFAKLANLPEVRRILQEKYNQAIPKDTIFIGAEHNTTTDEIVLFDSEIPNSHQQRLENLKNDLKLVQKAAISERVKLTGNISAVHTKASDWSETRPEWGLAKNAGFIIGPRALSINMNMAGNCFLQSYNCEMDQDASALEAIMQGPMVVTQWINNHYYFSSVDNEKFGGGSKIFHNVTGKFGVVQGNGGDLKMGLPLQSVNLTDEKIQHRPLRLSVLIQAKVENVEKILLRNEKLKSLLDNEWIYLMVMDPTENNSISKYHSEMTWEKMLEEEVCFANIA